MSSWLPLLADILVASSHPESDLLKGSNANRHLQPFCRSIEGYGPRSTLRKFDFTPCFESAVLLPAPYLILIVAGLVDVARIQRKGPRRTRSVWSLARLWIKMAAYALGFLTALAVLILEFIYLPNSFSNIVILPSILHLIALSVLAATSWYNHWYSLRSSTVILLFWPPFLLAIATTLRTQFSQDPSDRNYQQVYGLWNSAGKAITAMSIVSFGFAIIAWLVEIWGPESGSIRIGEEIDYVNGSSPKSPLASSRTRPQPHSRSTGAADTSYSRLPRSEENEEVILEQDEEMVDGRRVENGNGGVGRQVSVKRDMEEKITMEEAESPVLRANIYSRLTFGFLTRK